MSMKSLESSILSHLRAEIKNSKFKLADLLEWSTSEAVVKKNMRPADGEIMVALPAIGVFCAINQMHDKRK